MSTDDLPSRMMAAPLIGHMQVALIPSSSGVYTAWLQGEPRCLYVGRAGNSPSGNLRKRIRSHFLGQRGSDQFCLYVYDAYVHAERTLEPRPLITSEVNRRTAQWVRDHVQFRFLQISESEATHAEERLRQLLRPILNPP